MPTIKKRINITVPETVELALEQAAKRDHVPQATKAAHLLQIALELEEDQIWDEITQKRDTKNALFVPHKKARE